MLQSELDDFNVLDTWAVADPMLAAQLDRGEAAVMATATRHGNLAVLMDERKGRRVATLVYRLEVIGTAGLLVAAKRRGIIQRVGPCLEGMREAGYFLADALVAECLKRAGE